MSIESLVCIERVAIDPEVATADVRSHYKTALGSTHQSARLRSGTAQSNLRTETNRELCIRSVVGMTMSLLVQMIASDLLGFSRRFLKLGHELRAACGHDPSFWGEIYDIFGLGVSRLPRFPGSKSRRLRRRRQSSARLHKTGNAQGGALSSPPLLSYRTHSLPDFRSMTT